MIATCIYPARTDLLPTARRKAIYIAQAESGRIALYLRITDTTELADALRLLSETKPDTVRTWPSRKKQHGDDLGTT